MKRLYFLIILFIPTIAWSQYHTDIQGTNDNSDGARLQLAPPSESHFLRLFSGENSNPKPYLYYLSMDTFRIANGLGDFSNFTERLTILPNGFTGINNPKPTVHWTSMISSGWAETLGHPSGRVLNSHTIPVCTQDIFKCTTGV